MGYFYDDAYEVICKVLKLDKDQEDIDDSIEDLLYEEYGMEFEDASKLIKALLPLCGEGESPLTGKYYVGFCDRETDEWLLKTEYSEL